MASDSSDEESPRVFAICDSDADPEDVVEPFLQVANYCLNEDRIARSRSRILPILRRYPLFCKRGLTLMHNSLARFATTPSPPYALSPSSAPPPPPLRFCDDPDLLSLRPISRPDLSEDTKHTGRILFGTLCVEPFVISRGQMSVLEEPSSPGGALRVAIYNSDRMFPAGTRVAIKEPYFKSPILGICVEDPGRGMVEVAAFPVALELEGMEALRLRGNECYRRCQWKKAAALYTRCIDKRPEDADSGHLLGCLVPAFSNRAAAHLSMGECEKALDDADEALAMEERHMKSLYRKGRALEEMGRFEEAEIWLGKAKEEAQKDRDVEEIAGDLKRVRIKGLRQVN